MPARLYCLEAYCSKDGAGGESHAYVPKRRSASKPKRLPTLPPAGMSRHYGAQERAQEETKNWFLPFSQKLREIFSGFAIEDSLDSRVAEEPACR